MKTFSISVDQCPFEKTNLVTKRNSNGPYDEYRCKSCSLIGKRYGLTSVVITPRNCNSKATKEFNQVRIISTTLENQFGLKVDSVHPLVPIPEHEKKNFPNSIWVFSISRNEPVRLLSSEYEIVVETNPQLPDSLTNLTAEGLIRRFNISELPIEELKELIRLIEIERDKRKTI